MMMLLGSIIVVFGLCYLVWQEITGDLEIQMKRKNAFTIYKSGKYKELDSGHVVEIIQNLYRKGIANIFFIGMGWPEGYHYCSDYDYLNISFAPIALEKYQRQIWFACGFLEE